MVSPHLSVLSTTDRERLEAWLVDFDQSWNDQALPSKAARLEELPEHIRAAALAELVKIDLERQWQQGGRVTLNSYLQKYPALGTTESVAADLILAEYEIRRQFKVPVDLDEFIERFPRQEEELRKLLASADAARSRASAAPMAEPPRAERDTSKAALSTDGGGRGDSKQKLPREFGRYRIVKRLGEGGMGAVYLAHDSQLDREVALKIPRFSARKKDEIVSRFIREARSAATICHPNVCPVFDVGEIDGIYYLTMAYIQGRTLSEFIRPEKPLPERQVAAVVCKLALALQEAHDCGVVHRDLKPANIMIDRRSEPVIMDFGLARRTDAEESRATQRGTILGTPAYMSPEQVLGEPDQIGPQTDVYSLGVILYELLTGKLPYEGPPTAVVGQILAVDPLPPEEHRTDLDPKLAAICGKAMAKKREERYGSMKDLAADLTEFLKHARSVPSPPAGKQPPQKAADHDSMERAFANIAASGIRSVRRPSPKPLAELLQQLAPLAHRHRNLLISVAAGMLFFLVLWGLIVSLETPDGTLIVEIDDPDAKVQVLSDEGQIRLEGEGKDGQVVFSVDPGKRRVRVEKDGEELFAQDVTIVSGKERRIRAWWESSQPEAIWDGRIRDAKTGTLRPARIVLERGFPAGWGKDSFPNLDVAWTYWSDGLLNEAMLEGADVLVVSDRPAGMSFADAEIEAIVRFVERGGGLLIGSLAWVAVAYNGYTESNSPPNQVAKHFGMLMKATYAGKPAKFADHPITRGLSNGAEFAEFSVYSPIVLMSDEAKPLIWDHEDQVIYAQRRYGKGRVCFSPTDHFCTDTLKKSPQYTRLLHQIFEWLCSSNRQPEQVSETVPSVAAAPSADWQTWSHSLMTSDALDSLYCTSGLYGPYGKWLLAEVVEGEGIKINDGFTQTGLWAPISVGPSYRVSLEAMQGDEFRESRVRLLLGGPGYGNNTETSYCVLVKEKDAVLMREGIECCSASLPSPKIPGRWFHLEAQVDRGDIQVLFDGVPILQCTDSQPLTGALHGWVGFVGRGATWYRNLQISGPQLDAKAERELLPPLSDPPLPNGSIIYELAMEKTSLEKDWWLSWPEAVNINDGLLDLRDPNAVSLLLLKRPLHGNVAMEAEIEYPSAETLNFQMAFWTAERQPEALADRVGGWFVWLPDAYSTTKVYWHDQAAGFDRSGFTKSVPLATTSYHSPVRGRRYLARLEAVGDRARVFLDGSLILDTKRPKDAAGKNLPLFAAIGQNFSPVFVHALRIYQLDEKALESLPKIEPPHRSAAEWVLGLGGSLGVLDSNGNLRTIRNAAELGNEPFQLVVANLPGSTKSASELQHLAGIETLDRLFAGNAPIQDSDLAHLDGSTALQVVHLFGTKVTDPGVVRFVNHHPNLVELSIGDTELTDAILAHIGQKPRFQRIGVGGTRITDKGIRHLESLPDLRSLQISNTAVTSAGLKSLHGHSKLEILNLSGLPLGDDDVRALPKLEALWAIHLDDTRISDDGIAALVQQPNLRHIYLARTPVSDAALEHLAKLPRLELLALQDTAITNAGLEKLKGVGGLTTLILNGTQVTQAGVAKLQAALPKSG